MPYQRIFQGLLRKSLSLLSLTSSVKNGCEYDVTKHSGECKVGCVDRGDNACHIRSLLNILGCTAIGVTRFGCLQGNSMITTHQCDEHAWPVNLLEACRFIHLQEASYHFSFTMANKLGGEQQSLSRRSMYQETLP